jgi:hypothetical protein
MASSNSTRRIAATVTPIMIALALTGCAKSWYDARATHPAPVSVVPTPTCSTDADCTVKWGAARTFVLAHTVYKIQTYSPDFMQTFSPAADDAFNLAAEVNREPLPGGGSRIVAKFWCGPRWDCSENQGKLLDEFNRTVAAAGVQP